MEEHYELYKGYIGKTNEIQEKLDAVDRATREPDLQRPARAARRSVVRDRRRQEPRDLLRAPRRQGRHAERPGSLEQIKRDFPSYDAWLADFKASGLAARGWVWLAYDHDWNCLTTVVGDAQNTFPLWNATPILALDVYEHAYWIDYGRARAKYIEAFFNNLDWGVVEQNLERALAMQAVHK